MICWPACMVGRLQDVHQGSCNVLQVGQHQPLYSLQNSKCHRGRPTVIQTHGQGFLSDRDDDEAIWRWRELHTAPWAEILKVSGPLNFSCSKNAPPIVWENHHFCLTLTRSIPIMAIFLLIPCGSMSSISNWRSHSWWNKITKVWRKKMLRLF